jgi:hypothetical protein
MFGGDKDFNHKKDMPPIASLVFAMKKERVENVDQIKFVQQTIKSNKEMVRTGKVLLANYVLGEGESTNPHIKVPDVSQRSARLTTFTTFDKVNVPTFNNEDHQGEEEITKVRQVELTRMMRDLPVTSMQLEIESFVFPMEAYRLIPKTRLKMVCS